MVDLTLDLPVHSEDNINHNVNYIGYIEIKLVGYTTRSFFIVILERHIVTSEHGEQAAFLSDLRISTFLVVCFCDGLCSPWRTLIYVPRKPLGTRNSG